MTVTVITEGADVTDVVTMTENEDGDETTQIRVSKAQRAELHNMKRPGESYKDVLGRLLESDENQQHSG